MKIILSRKGFDGQSGGVASPIFPDGSMVSLPIPTSRSPTRYSDLRHGNISIGELAADLTGRSVFRAIPCHFDPDLVEAAVAREPGWRPAFGQVNAALTHLTNQRVGPGDLFLFFGWFRQVELGPDGKVWRFRRGAPDIHALFGWLQVDRVVKIVDAGEVKLQMPWLARHPHLHYGDRPRNAVYVARERLQIGGRDCGAGGGVFSTWRPELQLTAHGESRSNWRLPGWFLPETGPCLTYHVDPSRWSRDGDFCRLRTVGKGQEFVMDIDGIPDAEAWVRGLFQSASAG